MSEKNKYRVRLVRWGDSSSSGRTVTFKLPDDGDEHPFKGLDVGAKNGQLLEMEIAIYDGEGDVESLGTTHKPRAKVQPRLPIVKDDSAAHGTSRRRATLENVTRRVVKPGSDRSAADAHPVPGGSGHGASPLPTASNAATTPGDPLTPGQPSIADTGEAEMSAAPTPKPFDSDYSGMGNGGGCGPGSGGSNLDGADLDAYANQMGQAAEALAAVAERLEDQSEDDQPQFPTIPADADDNVDPGVRAVRRATDLCKAIDKQRAGFYYFMRSRYPQAPKLAPEAGEWSRDAKSTRDRVCLHCEAENLSKLAQDPEARRKFEELENEFERHERLR